VVGDTLYHPPYILYQNKIKGRWIIALLQRISEEELEFMETLCDPVAMAESLFYDYDNLQLYSDTLFGHVRLGQLAMLSYEYLIDDKNPTLSAKENFKLLEGAGTLYNFGARRFGKSLISLIIDMLESLIHLDNWHCLYSSYDALHILQILERVIPAAENHPFLQIFEVQTKRSPNYVITAKNGFEIQSVNMNISSKTAGSNFFGHHTKKLWADEYSKTTSEVEEKIVDASSELGCIDRFAGMTDFTRHSPAGKIYDDYKRKPWVCNFPQYISPMWDDLERLKQERRYGGSKTVAYRTFVKGEICEDGISVFDMDRVRANYNENKTIKNFELNKDNFKSFKQILIVERPKNASLCIIGADIGETAPTEIVITFKINDKYNYAYNITLYNLTDKQQYHIFKYLMILLGAEATGIDCGDGTGRSIYRRLEEDFTSQPLFFYDGSKKIAVGYKKDSDGKITMINGKLEVSEEFMSEWSVKHFKTILYDQLMVIPQDFKFDTQINSVISLTLSNRTVYECVSPQNHLFDAFKVWALTQWNVSFNESNLIKRKNFSKTGC